eukprot:4182516-Prymnesium_polylepis.1
MVKRTRRLRLPARRARGAQPELGAQRALIAAIADSERARHMALPQGIRRRGSRPRDCTGIDGSEHLYRVSVASIWHPGTHLGGERAY